MNMEKKIRYAKFYMDIANKTAEMSYCVRLKVGCVIEKDGNIIAFGWNGMPSGFPNVCETDNVTNPEVLHAEENAIAKLAKGNVSGVGATLYCTHAPCIHCAKLIAQSGIKEVWYGESYRDTIGIDHLTRCGLRVVKL